MALQTRVLVGEKGRLVIPIEIREALGIDVGDALELNVEEDELHISTRQSRLRRAQQNVRKYVPEGVLLSEELSAERREAAKHE